MQLAGDLARPAVSDALSIHLRHRQHLHGRIGQETLVGDWEVSRGQPRLFRWNLQFAGQSQHHVAGDAGKDAAVRSRRQKAASKGHEYVAGCPFGHLPLMIQQHGVVGSERRSEEHTSELQSQSNLVCRLLLEKKNNCSTLNSMLPSISEPSIWISCSSCIPFSI